VRLLTGSRAVARFSAPAALHRRRNPAEMAHPWRLALARAFAHALAFARTHRVSGFDCLQLLELSLC